MPDVLSLPAHRLHRGALQEFGDAPGGQVQLHQPLQVAQQQPVGPLLIEEEMSRRQDSDSDAEREPLARDVEEAYEESGYSPERASRRAEDAADNADRTGQLDEADEDGEKGTGLLE